MRAELTALGEKRFEAGVEIVEKIQEEFVASLPKADRDVFERVLMELC